MSLGVTWHSVDLKTGRRGPQLSTQTLGSVSRKIGESSDVSGFAVRCWDGAGAVPGWDAATLPGRVMLVACDEATDAPLWGGMVIRRRRTKAEWVPLDMVTIEGYFDRRYVTDHTYTQTAQGVIVSGLLAAHAVATGVTLNVDANSATLRDRTYLDDDDKTLLSVLQELSGVLGGPEWTVDLEWSDDSHATLNRIVRVRDRIGASPGLPVRFELPGSVADFEFIEDYSSDSGANDVMATSSGEGDIRPESPHAIATDLLANGWVKFEERFTPSTSITDVATLDAHAQAELAQKRDGLTQINLTCQMDQGPQYGVDFHLGDDVTVALTCPSFPERVGPDGDHIPGYEATTRCVGVTLDFQGRKMTPTVLDLG